jgi:hypothetical protein
MSTRQWGDRPLGHAKAAHGVSGSRSLGGIVELRRLEGYGLFEALHVFLEVLNLARLLG